MYRGPHPARVGAQFDLVMRWHGETGTWRQFVSAGNPTGSAVWGGQGVSAYYRTQTITALWAAPQMGDARFRETQLPGGQVMAGDAVVSTIMPFNSRDQIVWRGVQYRIEGDSSPIQFAGRVWYRTVLRRGDATG